MQNPFQRNSIGDITTPIDSCTLQNSSGCVVLPITSDTSSVVITVTGSFSGVLNFVGTNATFPFSAPLSVTPIAGGSPITSTTSAGVWTAQVAGLTVVGVRASAMASGTATVTVTSSVAAVNIGGGSGSVTLNDVLDLTADKTFVGGLNLLTFNGTVLVGINDPVAQGFTGFFPGNQDTFINGAAALSPFIATAELTDTAPTITAGSSFAGANIVGIDARNSGIGLSVLSALQLDATLVNNISTGTLEGIGTFVWNVGGAALDAIYGLDTGLENDGGAVAGNMITYRVQQVSNSGVVAGFIAGLGIGNQKHGTATGGFYAIKLEDQGAGGYAIKSGTGLVSLGDDTEIVGDLQVGGSFAIATHTPATSSDTGGAGQIAWDASFVYVCIATNTWKRTALASW